MDTSVQVYPELDLDRLLARYSATRITRPHWPARGAHLTGILIEHDRFDDLEGWESRLTSQVQGEWASSCYCNRGAGVIKDISRDALLALGVSRLPLEVVQAAHKRLFGSVGEMFSGTALTLIGHALFNPPFGVGIKGWPLWRDLITKAELSAKDDQLLQANLLDLLAELEVA
ncbi:hypothetical protein [Synechococcus sp. LTW-G]